MREELEFIKETIELDQQGIKHNVEVADELVTNDLLKVLGYDRRRDKCIERVRIGTSAEPEYIWRISIGASDKEIVTVKTVPYNTQLSNYVSPDILKESACLVLTNCVQLGIFTQDSGFKPLRIIEIFNDSAETNEVLELLKKNGNIKAFLVESNKEFIRRNAKDMIGRYELSMISSSFCQKTKLTPEEVVEILKELKVKEANASQENPTDGSKLDEQPSEIKALDEKVKALEEKVKALEVEKGNLETEKANLETEKANLETEKGNLETEKGNLETEKGNLETEKVELEESKKTLEAVNAELGEKSDKLESENAALKAEKEGLVEKLEQLESKNQGTPDESENLVNLQSKLSETEKSLERLTTENGELREKLAELSLIADKNQETPETSEPGEPNKSVQSVEDTTSAYIKQIQDLAKKLSDKDDEINKQSLRIKELEEQIENRVDPRIEESKNLLNTIEDNPEEPKSYVGVVDGNLFQAPSLEKFIGCSLQELYSRVTFELMPYIFDGDIFNISEKAVRNDLLIANKMYDIDLSGMSEEESLQRLKTLFNKFPTVVFFFKTIGAVVVDTNDNCGAIDFGGTSTEDFGDGFFDGSGTVENIDGSTDEIFEEQSEKFSDTSDDGIGGNLEVNGNVELFEGDEYVAPKQLHLVPLSGLSRMLWDETVKVNSIEYINYFQLEDGNEIDGSGECRNIFYRVNNDSVESQVNSLIYSVISYSLLEDKARVLSNINFASISNFVHPVSLTDEAKGIRIPYTNYQINSNILAQTIPVISGICDALGVNTNNIEVYMDCEVAEGSPYSSESTIDADTIDLPIEYTEFVEDAKTKPSDVHCIISGSVLANVPQNDVAFDIEANIIKQCIAVKTDYLTYPLRTFDDATHVFTEILALSEIPIEEAINRLGNVCGTDFKVISRKVDEVNPENTSTILNGDTYYISNMEQWQLMNTMIKLHVLCANNKNIGIRAILNRNALDFYSNQFMSCDPVADNISRAIVDYMSSRLK